MPKIFVKRTEKDWVESIKELLKQALSSEFKISTQDELPYAWEIWAYVKTGKGFSPAKGYEKSQPYETDLLIYEEIKEQIKPRIIIEAKISNPTTHDAITYSHKAAQHKAVMPYLRYGMMVGLMRQHYPLPGRLFRHGINFDFMIGFKEAELTPTEKDSLIELINSEWHASEQIEEMLSESRNRKRKRYFMLQNALCLKEIGN